MDITRVKHVLKAQKAQESQKQILGNMAGFSVFEDMNPEHIKEQMMQFIEEQFSDIESNEEHPFWKSRAKAQDKYIFLNPQNRM